MASLQIQQATIAAVADQIVESRRLFGKDSSYAIGLLTGIVWLTGDDSDVAKQIQALVLELESDEKAPVTQGEKPPATSSPSPPDETKSEPAQGANLAENTWIRGAVKWFNNDKGYGFISTDANTDVFVHWRDISSWDRSLAQGDPVEFMVTKTAKGFQAINVMKPDAGGETEANTETQEATESAPGCPPAAATDGDASQPVAGPAAPADTSGLVPTRVSGEATATPKAPSSSTASPDPAPAESESVDLAATTADTTEPTPDASGSADGTQG